MQDITYTSTAGIFYSGRKVTLRVNNPGSGVLVISKFYVENVIDNIEQSSNKKFVFFLNKSIISNTLDAYIEPANYTIPYQQNFINPPFNYQSAPYNSSAKITIPGNSFFDFNIYFVPFVNGFFNGKCLIKESTGASFIINLKGSRVANIENVDTISFETEIELVSGLGKLEITDII